MTSCAKALATWSEKNEGAVAEQATFVDLLAFIPPINKMDAALNGLVTRKLTYL